MRPREDIPSQHRTLPWMRMCCFGDLLINALLGGEPGYNTGCIPAARDLAWRPFQDADADGGKTARCCSAGHVWAREAICWRLRTDRIVERPTR
jgi:hypothetical protein